MPSANIRVVAPFASFAVTWGVRQGMTAFYRKHAGEAPPAPDDMRKGIVSAIAWAVATATVSAAAEVIVLRLTHAYSPDVEVQANVGAEAIHP